MEAQIPKSWTGHVPILIGKGVFAESTILAHKSATQEHEV